MGIARPAVVLLLVPTLARAEPPQSRLGIFANAGVGMHIASYPADYGLVDHNLSLSVKVDVGYRLNNRTMLGIHAAVASAVTQYEAFPESMFDTDWKEAVRPLQVGISGVYTPHDRIFVEGWAGIQHAWRATVCTTMIYNGMPGRPDDVSCPDSPPYQSVGGLTMAIGGTIGVDAIARGDHRLTISLSASHAFDADVGQIVELSYTQFSIDVGYRFWTR